MSDGLFKGVKNVCSPIIRPKSHWKSQKRALIKEELSLSMTTGVGLLGAFWRCIDWSVQPKSKSPKKSQKELPHKKGSHSMGALPDYWGWCLVGALVSPKQPQTSSSARHTLSHATSSQPTAIPTPDDTPVSTLAHICRIFLNNFCHLWLQWQYLFPSLIWIHCLFRDVSSNSNNYTFLSKQEPHQSYRARHKKSFQNNLLACLCLCLYLCLCLCGLNPVPVCSHQLCLFFEGEGNVVGGFSIGAPGTGSETRVTSAIAEPLSGRRSPAKTTNRMILQLDIAAS